MYTKSMEDELYFLSLDPIFLKLKECRDATMSVKGDLEKHLDELHYWFELKYFHFENRTEPAWVNHDLYQYDTYKVMLELKLQKAELKLKKMEEEASCVTSAIAKRWNDKKN